MLVALLIGLVVVVGVAVYFLKRKKVEDVYADIDGSVMLDDIYPIGALEPEEPAPVEPPPVVEPVVKAAPKKRAVAKKTAPKKKRGRPAKKTKK